MPSARSLFCLAAACVGLTAAAQDYVDPAALKTAGLVKFWQLQLPLAAGEQLRDAYLVDDQLYFGTDLGTVYAVHAYTGAIRWAQLYTSGGYRMARPAHLGDRTIIATSPEMRQYDRLYGAPILRTEFRFPAGTGAVSDGLRILVGGFDRRMYAFPADLPYESWKVMADSQISSTPAVWKDFLFFGTGAGTVYACESANKQFIWRTRLGGSIEAPIVSDDNGVYVANADRSLYLLDHVYGGLRWRARFPNPLNEAPVLTPEVAYQYAEGDGLVALDVAAQSDDNRVRWKFAAGRTLATATTERAYAWTQGQSIAELDLKSGQVLHEVPAPGFSMVMPSTARPAVMLAASDGRIFCAQHVDEPFVTAEEVRAALSRDKPQAEPPAGDAAAEQPAVAQKDYLGSTEPGKPTGGKSKVSREFGGGGGTQP